MVCYLTPASFTWFTVEWGEAGVWAHTAICWKKEGTGRRASSFTSQTCQNAPTWLPKMSPATSRTNSTKIQSFIKGGPKKPQMEQPVWENDRWKGGVKSAAVWIWWRNRMFPGLVRLVSMVQLVSMVFHQTHLATRAEYLEWLRQSSGSAWEWSRCLQSETLKHFCTKTTRLKP